MDSDINYAYNHMNGGGGLDSSASLKYVPIWLLNLGIIYIITTAYYFIMKNMNKDPIKAVLDPFPKLMEHYEKERQYDARNIVIGCVIGSVIIYLFKPFGRLF